MTNFYVKKIESGDSEAQISTETKQASGAILKTNTQVGVFNGSAADFYVKGQLNTAKGKVYNQNAGTDYMPTRSNLSNKEYLVDGWEEDNPFRDAFVIQVNARQEEEILENLKYVEGVGITASQVSRNPYEYFIRLLINKLR